MRGRPSCYLPNRRLTPPPPASGRRHALCGTVCLCCRAHSLHAHFLLAFHSRPAYKARLSKPGVFDGQEGFEACVDFGRRQNVEDARSEENKCWTHRQKLEAI
jgi:hypothetical protein